MKLGVIGVGNMGRNHARVYSELGVLAAVSDNNEERAKEVAERFKCNYYGSYHEMIAKESLDGVSIAVPTSLHKAVALDIIEKGIPLLIEKPLADTVANADAIIAAARAKGISLMVGHVERFNPAVQKMKELIQNGLLGNISSIVTKRFGLFPPQAKDANIIFDLAVHDIDVINFLLSDEPRVVACTGGIALANGMEDHAEILLKYRNVNAIIQVNWITPIKIRQLSITGTKGYAELNYISQKLTIYESTHEREYDGFGEFVIKFGMPSTTTIQMSNEEPLKNELREFLRCVREKKEPEINGERALLVLHTAASALEKLKRGN